MTTPQGGKANARSGVSPGFIFRLQLGKYRILVPSAISDVTIAAAHMFGESQASPATREEGHPTVTMW